MNTANLTYSYISKLLYKENDKGYIAVFRKGFSGTVYTKTYRKSSLNKGLDEYFENSYTTELYQSMNTFITRERTIDSLRYLNALYIDLDFYKLKMRKESVLFFLENDFYNSVIPVPSIVVDSGRGLYLIWLIEQVPSQALTLWNAMQNYLYNALKEFGADRAALDAARVLRVVGSYNMKSNSDVKVVEFNDVRYRLRDLKDEFLPKVKPKKKTEKKPQKGKRIYIFNEYTLYKTRVEDLLKLAELRDYDFRDIHRREIFLFILRYYATLIYDEDEAEKLTFEINEKSPYPLSPGEIRSTFSRYIGKYKWKNETLIDLFEISQAEMKFMKSIISKEVKCEKNNEKRKEKRRNSEGLTQREAAKKEKLLLIVQGLMDGKNTKEISEEYDISIRLVQKYRKELTEDKELFIKLKEEIINSNKEVKIEDPEEVNEMGYEVELTYKEIQDMFRIPMFADVGS